MHSTTTLLFPVFPHRVELLEFGDFACPQSRTVRPVIDTVLGLFRDQLTYTFHHFPNGAGPQSFLASLALEAAKRQAKFRAMSQGLYALKSITLPTIAALATDIGLDQQRFVRDLLDDQLYDLVKADYVAGISRGVSRAPTVFVGGQQFHGKITVARLLPVIQHHVQQGRPAVLGSVDRGSGPINWGIGGFG